MTSKHCKVEKIIAERSFDLRTSGLWAQHASTAPLCSRGNILENKRFCQKWDSNPRPQKWTATWTQRLRPLGHPDSGLVRLKKNLASSGNRTRAARVAGEHSTTEPTMLIYGESRKFTFLNKKDSFEKVEQIVICNFAWILVKSLLKNSLKITLN